MKPAEAHCCPVSPNNPIAVSDCGRARHRIAVSFGMGERDTGEFEVLGNEDAGEEVVEAEEESQPVNSHPPPDMPHCPSRTNTI